MITRHMRTHIRPPGSPEFNPLAISQLSLDHSNSQLYQSDTIGLGPACLSSNNLPPISSHQLKIALKTCAANVAAATTTIPVTAIADGKLRFGLQFTQLFGFSGGN